MNTPNTKSPLWQSLSEEADRVPSQRSAAQAVLSTRPRFNVLDKLAKAWLTGYLPLLLLCMWVSKGYLVVLAPLLALLLLPLASGKHGVTPTRLLLLSVPAMLVIPKPFFQLGWLSDVDPRSPLRNTYTIVTYPEAFFGLGLLALICCASYAIQQRYPWFEAPQRGKLLPLIALLVAGFPVFLIGSELISGRETAETIAWESQVLSSNPHLRHLRLVHLGNTEWERIFWDAEGVRFSLDHMRSLPLEKLSQAQLRQIQDFEKRALPLIGANRIATLDNDTANTAAEVLDLLLLYPAQLEQPLEIYAAAESLAMLTGRPRTLNTTLEKHCEARLSQAQISTEVLEKELETLESLIEQCPDPIVRNDRHWYSQEHFEPAIQDMDTAMNMARKELTRDQLCDLVRQAQKGQEAAFDQLKDQSSFLSWLSRIVLHACYRLKKKHPDKAELPSTAQSPDRAQSLVDTITLQIALARLPQHDREVLVLHELLSLSHAEVGHALRIPEGTARSRLHTARKRLSEALGV